jgi:hypothetical protein
MAGEIIPKFYGSDPYAREIENIQALGILLGDIVICGIAALPVMPDSVVECLRKFDELDELDAQAVDK